MATFRLILIFRHLLYPQECAKALGILAMESCPLRDAALAPPFQTKLLAQLKKFLQDADSSVREAASEAAAALARGMAEASISDPGAPASTHPVGKMLLDCLQEGKRDLQASACAGLGLVSKGKLVMCCTQRRLQH